MLRSQVCQHQPAASRVPLPMSRRKGDPKATPVPTMEGQMTSIFGCLAPKLPNAAPILAFL